MTAVTPTDRPKSVRNSCVIKVFGGVFMLSRCFLDCSVGVGVFVTGLSQISSFFSCKMCKWCHRDGGYGSPSPEYFWWKWCKNRVIVDKINMEIALSWKPGIVCMTGEGITLWTLEVIRIFLIFTMFEILVSGASQKKNKNKIKTTFGPPLIPIKYPHKILPLTNLRGVQTPPPLWIRACKIQSI